MNQITRAKRLALSFLTSVVIFGIAAPFALAQEVVSGAVPLPPARPKVDQLGQMEGASGGDKTMLAIGLFLQVIALVAVAIALAGHLSMPRKKISS